jgi:hypothetical protein
VTNSPDLLRVRPGFCLSLRVTQFQRTQPTLDILGDSMTGHISTESRDLHAPAETRVWQAVITKTIQEWISGPLRRKREAEEYLFRDEKDFPLVCQSAGLDVGLLRAQLMRLRPVALTLQKSMI